MDAGIAGCSVETTAERRRRVMMPSVGNLYGDDPLELVRGDGPWVWNREGDRFLDMLSGVGVTNLGHCHPRVVAAARRQLETLQHATSLFVAQPVVDVAERLLRIAPGRMARAFFCADGSGAVEGAMMAARRATDRPDFLAFDRSLHGRTSLTLAATGISFWHSDPFPPPVVHRVPTPVEGTLDDAVRALDEALSRVDPGRCAAMVVEPILGSGGVVVPPAGYFEALRERLARHGILLVADEAQTGFCRTGSWFGMDHCDAEPDIVCVSKALANGLPAAAWLCTERVARSMTVPTASTFGGNLVCMAAAREAIDVMEEEDIAGNAARRGEQLMDGLRALARKHPSLAAPRGKGLMVGVPVRGGAAALDRLLMELRREGVVAGKCGPDRDVLMLEPPLVVSEEEIELALECVDRALERIGR